MIQLLYYPPAFLGLLGVTILAIISIGLFANNHNSNHFYWLHKLILGILVISSIWVWQIFPSSSQHWLAGHFIWTPLTALLSILLLALSLLFFTYTDHQSDTFEISDYYHLCLLSLFGALVMLTANSIVSFYLGLEIMSLPLYGLTSLGAKESLRVEAAIKYMIMGVLSSIFMLYGFCLMYLINGDLALASLISFESTRLPAISQGLLLAGILFKLGAVPFHFWVPDVYQSTALMSSAFIATIAKLGAIAMSIKLFIGPLKYLATEYQAILFTLGLLCIAVGNLMALMQTHFTRLLAYSSIAHMGFIVLGCALPAPNCPAVLFYGFNYCLMTTLLFGVLLHLKKMNIPIIHIKDIENLSRKSPVSAVLILIVVISMAGLPPLSGFFTKFGILYHLFHHHYYQVAGLTLATTSVGVYYYLNIIRLMYFQSFKENIVKPYKKIDPYREYLLSFGGLLLITISIKPDWLLTSFERHTQSHLLMSTSYSHKNHDVVKTVTTT